MPLRLAEAQQLIDAVNDPLLRPALVEFFDSQRKEALDELVKAVRKRVRDTMHEADLAGKVDAYENAMAELQRFAEKQIREATQ
jgi:hypothetical protein